MSLFELVTLALLLCLMIAAVFAAVLATRKDAQPENPSSHDEPEDELIECNKCLPPRLLTEDEVHRRITFFDDDRQTLSEAGLSSGGSAMVGEYCEDHCPGDCQYGCRKVDA